MAMNVSFAGCGFLGVYHVGVACCFRKYAPQLLLDKIAGASAGAIAACCLLCDLNMGEMVSDVLRVIHDARKRTLGPFSPSFDVQKILREGLDKFLPKDAHIRVNGRLRVSLTRVYDLKNVIVSDFTSRDELLQVLLASAWVPIFSGIMPPKVRGTRYMDGGLSDNLPTFNENTITVSPFCGESDICPRDPSSQLFHIHLANTSIEISRQNIRRFARILFPPDPGTLSELCKQGFDDTLRFLQRHNMLNCTSCLSVQSTFSVSTNLDDSVEYENECEKCKETRKEAMVAKVPENVTSVFQEAIDKANKGLMNWLFRHRSMKLLSICTLPYMLPIELSYVACTKTFSMTPLVFGAVLQWFLSLVVRLIEVLRTFDFRKRRDSKNVICQLAVTQCGDVGQDEDLLNSKNHLNYRFKVDLNGGRVQDIGDKVLSRRSSLVLHTEAPDDTVDNILKVTHHHDALLSFYFRDGQDKVNVTEIFEVTTAESESIFTPPQDDDLCEENVDDSIDEVRDDNEAIFSDPESEWKTGPDCRPEAERHRKESYKVLN